MFPEEFRDPFNHQTPARGSRQGVRGQRTSVLSFGVPKDKEFVICLFYFHICKAAGPDLIPFLCNCSHWVTWALGVVLESHHSPTQGWGPVLDQFSFSFNSHIVWTQWVKSPWNFLLSAGILHEICIHFFSYSFLIFILFPIFWLFFLRTLFNSYLSDEQLWVLCIRTFTFTVKINPKHPQYSHPESFTCPRQNLDQRNWGSQTHCWMDMGL